MNWHSDTCDCASFRFGSFEIFRLPVGRSVCKFGLLIFAGLLLVHCGQPKDSGSPPANTGGTQSTSPSTFTSRGQKSTTQERIESVLSCPRDANDANNPTNPQHPPFSIGEGYSGPYWTNVGCKIYLSTFGDEPSKDVTVTLEFPQATVDLVDSLSLPGGDIHLGQTQEDLTFLLGGGLLGTVGGTPSPDVRDGADQLMKWNFGDIDPGTSMVLELNKSNPAVYENYPHPESGFESNIVLDVTSSNAEVPADQLVPIDFERYRNGRWLLRAPNQISPNGRYVMFGRFLPGNGGGNVGNPQMWPISTDAWMQVNLPYYDAGAGRVLADGNFDSANSDHTLLVDPASVRIALWKLGSSRNVEWAMPKLASNLTGPTASNARQSGNEDEVFAYEQNGGFYRIEVGSIHQTRYYGWAVSGPWIDSIDDYVAIGDALPFKNCVHSKQLAATGGPNCSSIEKEFGTEPDPKLHLRHESWGLHRRRISRNEGTALQRYEPAATEFRLVNRTTSSLSGVNVYPQLPGDDEGRKGTFMRAVWSQGVTDSIVADELFFPGTSSQPWTISVSDTPSDYGEESNLLNRAIPQTSTSNWCRCDDQDGDPSNCTAAEVDAACSFNAEDVEEVRFHAPKFGSEFLWFAAVRRAGFGGRVHWSVDGDARFSAADTENNFDATDMTDASVGTAGKSTFTDSDGTARELKKTTNSEVTEQCRVDVGGWVGNHGIADRPVERYTPWCYWNHRIDDPIGKEVKFATEIYNWGTNSEVSDPFEFCGTAPYGWEYNGRYDVVLPGVSQDIPDSAVTVEYNTNGNRRLCVRVDTDTALEPIWDVRTASDAPTNMIARVWGDVTFGHGGSLQWGPRSTRTSDYTCTLFGKGTTQSFDDKPMDSKCRGYSVAGRPDVKLSVAPDANVIGPEASVGYDITVANEAFNDDGTVKSDGATGPIEHAAVYQKVTKLDDFPDCSEGDASSDFYSASSPDLNEGIYVSTLESPNKPADDRNLQGHSDWTLCVGSGEGPCDGSALSDAGIASRSNVEWVAYSLGKIRVTDAIPRASSNGTDHPFEMRYVLEENGQSVDGSKLCAFDEVSGSNIATAGINPNEVTIAVEEECGTGNTCDDLVAIANPDNKTFECTGTQDGASGAPVTLDGSDSALSTDSALSYSWSAPNAVSIDDSSAATTGSFFPLGSQSPELTVTETEGDEQTDTDTATFAIEDTTDPSISCPADTTVDADSQCVGHADPTAAGSDICDADPTVTRSPSDNDFSPGMTTVTHTVTDASGNTATCESDVTVVDNTSPTINVGTPQIELWPPNHKCQQFDVFAKCDITVTDNCSTDSTGLTSGLTQVTSDESFEVGAGGDGNTTDDIEIIDSSTVELRAERQGKGDGRFYEITIEASDEAGNTSTGTCQFVVPHDQNPNHTPVDSGVVETCTGDDGCTCGSTSDDTSDSDASAASDAAPIEFAAFCTAQPNYSSADVTVTNVETNSSGEPLALSWESDTLISTLVLKTGTELANHNGGTSGRAVSETGTPANGDQTSSSPCAQGEELIVKETNL